MDSIPVMESRCEEQPRNETQGQEGKSGGEMSEGLGSKAGVGA